MTFGAPGHKLISVPSPPITPSRHRLLACCRAKKRLTVRFSSRVRSLAATACTALLTVVLLATGPLSSASAEDASPTPTVTPAPLVPSADAPAADPAVSIEVKIAQISDPQQPADRLTRPVNRVFTYLVSYACSNLSGEGCGQRAVVTVPLGAQRSWNVVPATSPAIESASVTAEGSLVFVLKAVPEGSSISGQVGFSLTPPTPSTPNGTTWSLTPTLSFADKDRPITATAQTPVVSTATATFDPRIWKHADSQVAAQGATVSFSLNYYCQYSEQYGIEGLRQARIVDTLPPGLEYVSDSGLGKTPTVTGDPAMGQRIEWVLNDTEIKAYGCAASGWQSAPVWKANARVSDSVPEGTTLVNRVEFTATPISDAAPKTASDSASIFVSSAAMHAGSATKAGYGPVNQPLGDNPDGNSTEGYNSGTYTGRWSTSDPAFRHPGWDALNGAENGTFESAYGIEASLPTTGQIASVVDNLPCLEGSGPRYLSKLDGLCATPAFHAYGVQIKQSSWKAISAPADYAPTATLTDGTVVALKAVPQTSDLAYLLSWEVPDALVGRVARITIPPLAGTADLSPSFRIMGYVDEKVADQSTLVNRAAVTTTNPDGTVAGTVEAEGRLFVVFRPQIGASWTSAISGMNGSTPTATIFTGFVLTAPDPTAADLQMVVRVPSGLGDFTTSSNLLCDGTLCPGDAQLQPLASQRRDPATGDMLLTFTYPKAQLNAYLSDGYTRIRALLYLSFNSVQPGTYPVTSSVFLGDPRLDTSRCTAGNAIQGDPADLDRNGRTDDFHCDLPTSIRVEVSPFATSIQLSKSVKGSEDANFAVYPGVGQVAPTGGSADMNLTWRSTSGMRINGVVLYDMLPMPGDTGTLERTRSIPRGSTFRPILNPIGALPSGVAVQYATAANPCRPEVLPTNPGCTENAWQDAPPADLASVTALRFASSASYDTNQGFTVPLSFSMPSQALTTSDVAWNTVASSQAKERDGARTDPVESSRAGLATPGFSHLSIGKAADYEPVYVPNSEIGYTLHATNDGTVPLTNVRLTDRFTHGLTVKSAGGGDVQGDEIAWTLPTLAPGETVTRAVRLALPLDITPGHYENRLIASSETAASIAADINPCANDATQSCVAGDVAPYPISTIKKTADRDTAEPGGLVVYTIDLHNTGTADDTVSLGDTLDRHLQFVSAEPAVAAQPVDDPTTPTYLGWDDMPVAVGEHRLVTVTARVRAGAYDLKTTNLATGTSTQVWRELEAADATQCTREEYDRVQDFASDPQSGPVTPSSCATVTTKKYAPAISLVKSTVGGPVKLGQAVPYTFEITNTGAQTLTGVTLEETAFTDGAGRAITLDAPPTTTAGEDATKPLAPGATLVYTATHTVTQSDVDAGGSLANSARVRATAPADADGVVRDVDASATVSVPVGRDEPVITPTDEPTPSPTPEPTTVPIPSASAGPGDGLADTGAEGLPALGVGALMLAAGVLLASRRKVRE